MSDSTPPVLPPVPGRPASIPRPAGPPPRQPVTRPTPPPVFKTAFDVPPLDTLKARQAAEKARQAMAAAVKAAKAAQDAVNEAIGLGKEAAPTLAAEGLTPDVLKTFSQKAGPLVDAFGVAPAPVPQVTPPPAA